MVNLTKLKTTGKKDTIFKGCHILKKYDNLLKKKKISYTAFVNEALRETFGELK